MKACLLLSISILLSGLIACTSATTDTSPNMFAASPAETSMTAISTEAHSHDTTDSDTHSYPTQDRVRYLLGCIAQHNGLSIATQAACDCKISKIAEQLTFADYREAIKNPYAQDTKTAKFRTIEQDAERSCFMK